MINLGFRSLCCALSLVCASAPLLTGCSDASHEASIEETGSIGVALTATAADGAVYGFVPGTYVYIAGGSFGEYVPLDGPGTQIARTLPVGSYTATVYFPGPDPVLTRTEGTVTTSIDAAWTNPQPVSFTIVKGQTTSLVLHFSVEGLTDVVFDTGTLQIIADVVEEEVSDPGGASFSGLANLFYQVHADDSAAYASALAVDLGVDLSLSIGVELTGTWVQSGYGAVCQQGTLTAGTSSNSNALGWRLEQLLGAPGSFCVTDNGSDDYVSFYPGETGAPPASQAVFLPDPSYTFYGGIAGYVGDVYDGTTLQQTLLENAPLTNGYFYHYVYGATDQLTTAQGDFSGTVSLKP